MTLIAFVADVHVGNHRRFGGEAVAGINARCRLTIEALATAVEAANRAGCKAFVVLGDLFDTAAPTPQIISAVMTELRRFAGSAGVTLLLGNHEQVSATPGDHALGPLSAVARVVADAPQVVRIDRTDVVLVPFRPGDAREWLPAALASVGPPQDGDLVRVLGFHAGIEDERTPSYLRGAHDALPMAQVDDLLAQHGMSFAFAGNWHDARSWEGYDTRTDERRRIVQVGALCPTGFDNPGLEFGRMTILDVGARKVRHLAVPGPRFVKLREPLSDEAVAALRAQPVVRALFLDVMLPADGARAAGESIARLTDAGVIEGGAVRLDATVAASAAERAAKATQGATTLDAALASFVDALELPDGVDRAECLARSRSYLAGGEP